MPTYTPASAGGSTSRPVTATTGRPAAASSSSRNLVTPGRRLANAEAPHDQAHRRPGLTAATARERAVVGQPDRCLAPCAAHERPAAAAGEDAAASRRVVHAHDRAVVVAEVPDQRRRDERRLPRLVAAAVDDLDDRPAGPLVVDRRADEAVADRRQPAHGSGHGDTSSTGSAGTPGPLDDDVAGVPRRAALLLQRLVVLVEHDGRGEVGARRPRRGAGTDDDVDTAGGERPLPRQRPPRSARRGGAGSPPAVPGRPTARRPASARARQRRGARAPRRRSACVRSIPPPAASSRAAGWLAGSGGRRCAVTRQRGDVVGRAGGDEERPQPAGGPAHRRPPGEVDQLRRRPQRADLRQRPEPVDR